MTNLSHLLRLGLLGLSRVFNMLWRMMIRLERNPSSLTFCNLSFRPSNV